MAGQAEGAAFDRWRNGLMGRLGRGESLAGYDRRPRRTAPAREKQSLGRASKRLDRMVRILSETVPRMEESGGRMDADGWQYLGYGLLAWADYSAGGSVYAVRDAWGMNHVVGVMAGAAEFAVLGGEKTVRLEGACARKAADALSGWALGAPTARRAAWDSRLGAMMRACAGLLEEIGLRMPDGTLAAAKAARADGFRFALEPGAASGLRVGAEALLGPSAFGVVGVEVGERGTMVDVGLAAELGGLLDDMDKGA